jgi:hypothetical protein
MRTSGSVIASAAAMKSSIDSLEKLFGILLALAIGEAFKQFVSDRNEPGARKIHWDRLFALVSFLVLIVPFSHGMTRYFYDAYHDPPAGYWLHVVRDVVVFTAEGGLFFVLSRSLSSKEWRKFFSTAAILLLLDIGWGSWVAAQGNHAVLKWVRVNVVATTLLAGMIVIWRKLKETADNRVAAVGMALMIGRMLADYYFNFDFYFPPQSPLVTALHRSTESVNRYSKASRP